MSGSVLIIDYGVGNLGSVRRAFEECGASQVFVSSDPTDLKTAERVVLPGVGSFAKGMKNLIDSGWKEALQEKMQKGDTPLLGICLGMQLLASKGLEGGEIEGLDLIPGIVRKFETNDPSIRIPHVGWNELEQEMPSALFKDLPNRTDFYFVHSYFFDTGDKKEMVAGTTPYCGKFAAVVERENIFGTQFHPEKSQKSGFQIIKNFLNV